MNFNTEGLHPSFINTGMKRMQRLETRYAEGLKRIFWRLHKLRCSGKMERCKLLQANPGKNRWAKRIDFKTRHTFIDDLVVSRIGDGGKRLFAFEYLLRLRVETSALSDIQCLSGALNQVVE